MPFKSTMRSCSTLAIGASFSFAELGSSGNEVLFFMGCDWPVSGLCAAPGAVPGPCQQPLVQRVGARLGAVPAGG